MFDEWATIVKRHLYVNIKRRAMKAKKLTLTYVITYLAVGGLGLAFFPGQILKLFLSNGNYGEVMPRMAGMFMCALGFFVFRMVRYEDWKYYPATVIVRSGLVVFMLWLYFISNDPFFLVVNGIVLLGLIPSIIIQLSRKYPLSNP